MRLKKSKAPAEGQVCRAMVAGRSTFPTARLPLPYMWVPPEISNPVLLHHPTRKSVGYFGAVPIRDGKFVYHREEQKFNAESFFRFLQLLRRRASRRHRIVVIADNARYHHAILHAQWRRTAAGRFDLLFLPPYSPDLNPIERVWKLPRRQCIHHRYFAHLGDLIDVAEQ